MRLSGLKWLLFWMVVFSLGTLVVDLLYVYWPYPKARGLAAFRDNVEREWRLIAELAPAHGRILQRGQAIFQGLYRLLFIGLGIDALLQEAASPQQGANRFAGRWVQANRDLFLTAYYGLRLYALRLSVLLGLAPLLLCALIAVVDGLAAWWLRRLRAARESSFLYHRGKKLFALCFLALGACYLLPPVPLDPRLVVLPILAVALLLLRNLTAGFKKYL